MTRQTTGIPGLDEALGGGLLPGTLTVVIGATGVGKTQLGLHWLHHGNSQGESRGAIIDLSSRGDLQSHQDYAERMFQWRICQEALQHLASQDVFSTELRPNSLLPFLGYEGKRVLRSQMDAEDWDAWQSELNRRLPILEQFVYRHLIHGTRRFLVDGIEPQEDPEDSLQLELLENIYHRMLRKEADWLARDVFRQDYRANAKEVEQFAYNHKQASGMVLVTTRETMLEQLMQRPLADGDLVAGANTLILMGRVLESGRMKRALCIAKHRGSACDDNIRLFEINDRGPHLLSP
jgi:KaiC/GvpD/RAD55 family RecA-like ATPase